MSTAYQLADVCTIIMGQAPKGESYNTEGIGLPLIAGAGDFNGALPAPKKFTTEPSKISNPGDIILGIRASIGQRVIADGTYCLGRGVAALRPSKQLDPRFLWHWLSHSATELAAKAKGATFLQVNRQDIGELQIKLPPMPEQQRIAEALDRIDALRAKRREAIALLDDLTQAIFLDMFGDTRDISAKWPVKSVSEICSLVVDCINRTAPVVDYATPYKMIRTTNVKNGKVDLSSVRYVDEEIFHKWNRRTTPQRGDVLLTREAPVGESGILESDDQVFLGQRLMLYRADPEFATPEYLMATFRSPFLHHQFDKHGSGSTVKHLPLPVCRNFEVPTPPIALQKTFSERIDSVGRLKAIHNAHLAELDALFASAQHRGFRGELWNDPIV
nr:restriction endonuclease subunit S [Streptomyces sp. NBC_00830]